MVCGAWRRQIARLFDILLVFDVPNRALPAFAGPLRERRGETICFPRPSKSDIAETGFAYKAKRRLCRPPTAGLRLRSNEDTRRLNEP